MMWPGSNFAYNGNTTCTYTTAFNKDLHWTDKVDTVMQWMKDPTQPANLVMLYFDEPDYHGHVFSPKSPEVRLSLLVAIFIK